MTPALSPPYEDIVVGQPIPHRTVHISLTTLVVYAAASWDFHRYHYDADFAARSGLGKPVMDGQMAGSLMASLIMQWGGGDAFLRKLRYRQRSAVYIGDTLVIGGTVAEKTIEDGLARISCTMHILKDNDIPVVTDALAVIDLP